MTIELRQFRYFIAVAEEGHFGHAADRLRIAQPGLSQQIKRLEQALGVKLLVRGRRGVELTEEGRVFLDHARLVAELAERASETTTLASSGKTGFLKVGAPPIGMHPVGLELLREFQARRPDIEVEIHPGFAPQNLEALAKRALDAAIVPSPFDPVDDLSYLHLASIEILVALPKKHRLASLARMPRASLLEEAFLDSPRSMNPTFMDHIHRLVFGRDTHPHSVVVPDLTETSRLLEVAQGRGVTLISSPHLVELHTGVAFRPFEDPRPRIEFGVAWMEPSASRALPEFIELARELAEQPSPSEDHPSE